MKAMHHPNTIRFISAFEDKSNVYFAMELCDGGDLYDHILAWAPVAEAPALKVVQQMMQAIRYVHECDIAHRDIKPENFMFLEKTSGMDCGCLKLIDFGLSCACPPGRVLKTKVGTPYYVSPQVLRGSYDRQCDVWSAGVVMYLLLSGCLPFTGETHSDVVARVKEGRWTFQGESWQLVSKSAKNLLHWLLHKKPLLRFTAAQALDHHWFAAKPATCSSDLPRMKSGDEEAVATEAMKPQSVFR